LNRAWVTREVETETGDREYQVLQMPGMQAYLLPETLMFDTPGIEETLTPGEEGIYYIQFRRNGTADFCRIRLGSVRAGAVEINLNGLTGRVTIREVPFEAGFQTGERASGDVASSG